MTKLNGMDADTSRCVADHLAILTDQLGELQVELLSDQRGPRERVESALQTLWKLRWELGLVGGKVASDLADDSESEAAQ